ncbi:MAG: methyltransferase domain-containing protein [Propionibacteriaceae bacterium]|nr:methyltransferase domain-containing protein [Propionibacteriaceae bacterium]
MTTAQHSAPPKDARHRAQRWFQSHQRRSISNGYDRVQAAGSQQLSGAVLLANHRRMYGREAKTMLDIGCGDGSTLATVAKARPSITLVGTDPVAEAVSSARCNVPSAQVEQLSGALAGSFDAILIHLCLGLWDDIESQLSYAVSQLSPTGVLYIADLNAADAAAALETATTPAERRYLREQYAAAYTASGLRDLLRRCAPKGTSEVGTSPLGGYLPGSAAHLALISDPMVTAVLRTMNRDQDQHPIPRWVPNLVHGWVWSGN